MLAIGNAVGIPFKIAVADDDDDDITADTTLVTADSTIITADNEATI